MTQQQKALANRAYRLIRHLIRTDANSAEIRLNLAASLDDDLPGSHYREAMKSQLALILDLAEAGVYGTAASLKEAVMELFAAAPEDVTGCRYTAGG